MASCFSLFLILETLLQLLTTQRGFDSCFLTVQKYFVCLGDSPHLSEVNEVLVTS